MHGRIAPALLAVGAGLALGIAFAAEWWGGLVPCALCLVERWPYRVALCLGVVALLAPRGVRRVLTVLGIVTVLAGAAAAVVHVGVERGFWPSPLPECAAPRLGGGTAAERLAAMPDRPGKPCDEAIYAVDAIPVSFAEANLLGALLLAAAVAISLRGDTRRAA